jgi:hypothetical protein
VYRQADQKKNHTRENKRKNGRHKKWKAEKEKEKMERCTRKTLRGITCIMSKVNNKISGRKHATI